MKKIYYLLTPALFFITENIFADAFPSTVLPNQYYSGTITTTVDGSGKCSDVYLHFDNSEGLLEKGETYPWSFVIESGLDNWKQLAVQTELDSWGWHQIWANYGAVAGTAFYENITVANDGSENDYVNMIIFKIVPHLQMDGANLPEGTEVTFELKNFIIGTPPAEEPIADLFPETVQIGETYSGVMTSLVKASGVQCEDKYINLDNSDLTFITGDICRISFTLDGLSDWKQMAIQGSIDSWGWHQLWVTDGIPANYYGSVDFTIGADAESYVFKIQPFETVTGITFEEGSEFSFIIKDLTVTDATPVYNVSATANNEDFGAVSVNGLSASESVKSGREVVYAATPAENYKFVKWIDADGNDVSTDNPYNYGAADKDNALSGVFETTTALDAALTVSVSVYPNPSSDLVYVETAEAMSGSTIVVYDLKGAAMISKTNSSEKEILDISSLDNGIYYLRVKGEVVKLIKK